MPIITQALNIKNLRTTSAKSINLHTIKKLVELFRKTFVAKAIFFPIFLKILLSKGRSKL